MRAQRWPLDHGVRPLACRVWGGGLSCAAAQASVTHHAQEARQSEAELAAAIATSDTAMAEARTAREDAVATVAEESAKYEEPAGNTSVVFLVLLVRSRFPLLLREGFLSSFGAWLS